MKLVTISLKSNVFLITKQKNLYFETVSFYLCDNSVIISATFDKHIHKKLISLLFNFYHVQMNFTDES